MLVETDLYRAGYRDDRAHDRVHGGDSGVKSVGLVGRPPLAEGAFGALVFADQTTDMRASNPVANALRYSISPASLDAAATVLLTGRVFKVQDGTRIQVVGIVEDGKYVNLTEDPRVTMFLPVLQAPSSETWLKVGPGTGQRFIRPPCSDRRTGRFGHHGRDARDYRLRNGRVFGEQASERTWNSGWPWVPRQA